MINGQRHTSRNHLKISKAFPMNPGNLCSRRAESKHQSPRVPLQNHFSYALMESFSALWSRICNKPPEAPAQPQVASSCKGSSSSSSGDTDTQSEIEAQDEDSDSSEVSSAEKRRRQTAPARKAALKAKMMKKMAKQVALLPNPPAAEEYIPDLQPNCQLNQPGNYQHKQRKRRLRLIYSWFKAACSTLNSFFEREKVHHVIGVGVIDDTNMRLSTTVEGRWQSSRVVSVLNNCQTCVACFELETTNDQSQGDCGREPLLGYKSFTMHTPMTCLPRANAPVIFQELVSWMISFMGMSGQRWQHFGLRSDLLDKVPIICQSLCFDSLSTNIRITKMLRAVTFQQRLEHAQEKESSGAKSLERPALPLIGIACAIHQLALSRRALLFYHSGFWSSIVRLSHLFSVHSFRCQFRSALFAVLSESFVFIPVQALPQDHGKWHQERCKVCNLMTNDSDYKSKRLSWHMFLAKIDNGDCHSDSVTHWCKGGDCCRGHSPTERSKSCLLMICKFYFYLFGFGFAVPLAYRWKHAGPALQFCQESHLNTIFDSSGS